MSLDWNLTGIADYETQCWSEPDADGRKTLNPVTDALIWATMAVGIGEITAKDAPEFYARIRTWERVTQTMITEAVETADGITMTDRPLTAADVHAHIGLRTNVFPRESNTAWAKKITQIAREHAAREWRRLEAQAMEAAH